VPNQAEVTAYEDPGGQAGGYQGIVFQKAFAYRDYEDYVDEVQEYNQTELVHGGIFAQPFTAEYMFETFFKAQDSLGVAQWAYQTHELTLKGGTGALGQLELHPQCLAGSCVCVCVRVSGVYE
jgi:hypothetical protein